MQASSCLPPRDIVPREVCASFCLNSPDYKWLLLYSEVRWVWSSSLQAYQHCWSVISHQIRSLSTVDHRTHCSILVYCAVKKLCFCARGTRRFGECQCPHHTLLGLLDPDCPWRRREPLAQPHGVRSSRLECSAGPLWEPETSNVLVVFKFHLQASFISSAALPDSSDGWHQLQPQQ